MRLCAWPRLSGTLYKNRPFKLASPRLHFDRNRKEFSPLRTETSDCGHELCRVDPTVTRPCYYDKVAPTDSLYSVEMVKVCWLDSRTDTRATLGCAGSALLGKGLLHSVRAGSAELGVTRRASTTTPLGVKVMRIVWPRGYRGVFLSEQLFLGLHEWASRSAAAASVHVLEGLLQA